jgi:hypothetical protein
MRISVEVELDLQAPVTQRSVVDAPESRYPVPSGTIRDHVTQARWLFLRFVACGEAGWALLDYNWVRMCPKR